MVDQTDELQWGALRVHGSLLEDLQSRVTNAFPSPTAPPSSQQRIHLFVPTPESVLTIGSRGTATSQGRAIGPSGFGLRTVDHFGAEIQGRTCIDTVGLTILHSDDSFRLLTQADLGIASQGAMRVGTDTGDVEITAGGVTAPDPSFTVVPDMDVPDAADVNTGGPRGATEGHYRSVGVVWQGHDAASAVVSLATAFGRPLASGVASHTLSSRLAGFLGRVRSAITAMDAYFAAQAGTAAGVEARSDAHSTSDPAVKIHGAGGVKVTSPSKISLYSDKGIDVVTLWKASIKAGWEASLKAAGNAKVYGVASVAIQSLGLVGIKGKTVTVGGGDYAEVKAKKIAAIDSGGAISLKAKDDLEINGGKVGVLATELSLSAENEFQCHADNVTHGASQTFHAGGQEQALLSSDRNVRLEVGDAQVNVEESVVTLKAGSRFGLRVESSQVVVGDVTIRERETTIRGRVSLG